jgi:galactokinase
LLNTNVKHSLASSEYNTRRQECATAVALINQHHPEVASLRDVTEEMLQTHVQIQNPIAYKRSIFIVQEIQRLIDGCADLQKGNIEALGKKMFATHFGLSNLYEVSCKELDFLVNAVSSNPNVLGSRMMGGGFGGCTINLVHENAIPAIIESIKPAYEKAMGLTLDYYIASIENGTELI